jgi:hypothetical protein
MARIRTIKPEFFRHYDLWKIENDCSLPIRVAYIGLWTVADREGRFRWRPPELKVQILPYDDVDFGLVLDALHASGFVHKYIVDGEEYGCIPSWHTHQVINQREAQSKLPAPEAGVVQERPLSRHIPAAHARHVRAHAKACCMNCGSTDDIQFDHIIPFSNGGTHDVSNLQLLCKKCNLLKSDKLLADDKCTHVHAHAEPVHARGEGKGKELNKDAAPSARNGFDCPETQDAALFERGKDVLGNDAGGLIAKLKKAKGGSIALARAAIETASTKQNPREYVGAVIRGDPDRLNKIEGVV